MTWSTISSAALTGIKLAYKNLERTLLIAALIGCAAFSYLYNIEKDNREMAELTAKGLPPGILAKYIQKNRELIQLVKNAEGKTVVKKFYVPDEGKLTVITKERDVALHKYNEIIEQLKQAKNEDEINNLKKKLDRLLEDVQKPPTVIVKNKGFTSRFGYGFAINPDFKTTITGRRKTTLPITPELDWKFGYWNRWSVMIQVNPYFAGPAITYHVDKMSGRLQFNNLEVGITGGFKWSGGKQAAILLRSNF